MKKTAAHHRQKHLVEMTKMSEELATIRDSRNLIEKKLRTCVCSSAHKGVILTKNHCSNASELKTDQIMANAKAEIKRLVSDYFQFSTWVLWVLYLEANHIWKNMFTIEIECVNWRNKEGKINFNPYYLIKKI